MIDNYLDGKLSNDETEKFEEYYFSCDTCFKELKFIQELRNLIKENGEELLGSQSANPLYIGKYCRVCLAFNCILIIFQRISGYSDTRDMVLYYG